MNTFFYLAIDRTDLGKSVAIEFIGPIAVAAAMTRTVAATPAPSRSPSVGVVVLGGVELDGNTRRPAVHPRRLGDVGRLHRRRLAGRPARPRRRRARRRPGDRRRRLITPFGAPGSGPVWARRGCSLAVPARRRVLQRHRLRHRPVRAAAHPGPPLLRAARPAAGHRARDRLDRPRPAPVGARPRRHRPRPRRRGHRRSARSSNATTRPRSTHDPHRTELTSVRPGDGSGMNGGSERARCGTGGGNRCRASGRSCRGDSRRSSR